MRWFKVVAVIVGVFIAYLIVASIVGFFFEVVIAALAVAATVLAIKVVFYRKQVTRSRLDGELRESTYSSPLPRHNTRDVDDELARLKREMGG
jgi:hypothetical protein